MYVCMYVCICMKTLQFYLPPLQPENSQIITHEPGEMVYIHTHIYTYIHIHTYRKTPRFHLPPRQPELIKSRIDQANVHVCIYMRIVVKAL